MFFYFSKFYCPHFHIFHTLSKHPWAKNRLFSSILHSHIAPWSYAWQTWNQMKILWYSHRHNIVRRSFHTFNCSPVLSSVNIILCVLTSWIDVERACEQRSPKGQGLLRKKGAPTYAILSQNLYCRNLRAFSKASQGFQQKPSCFCRVFKESQASVDLSTKSILLS